MKHLKIFAMAFLCVGLLSCEKRHINDNLEEYTSVCIRNNGLHEVLLYSVEGTTRTFEINTYCAGFYAKDAEVRLKIDEDALARYNAENNTSYEVLPSDCYTVDTESKKMVDTKAKFIVTFDCDRICSYASDNVNYEDLKNKYVIPYTLVSETEGVSNAMKEAAGQIFIQPDMSPVTFTLVEPEISELKLDEEYVYLPFKLKTILENHWESEYNFALTLTDIDGTELSGAEYYVTCSSETESFVSGVSEITYDLAIEKSVVEDGLYVQAEVSGKEGGYAYVGEVVNKWSLILDGVMDSSTGFDRSGETWENDIIDSWQDTNRSPAKLIDGNLSTYWCYAWNNTSAGGNYNAELMDYPWIFDFALTGEIKVRGVALHPGGSGSELDALGKGYINYKGASDSEWVKAKEFDFKPSDRMQGTDALNVIFDQPVTAKYLQVYLTEGYRSGKEKEAMWGEFEVLISGLTLKRID